MEMDIIKSLKAIFYENYYKHFLLSNLQRVNELYIPLAGSGLDSRDTTNVQNRLQIHDIQAKIIASLSTTADRSFIVFGDGGAGKTTLALSIVHESWKKLPLDKSMVIPIYIHLPHLLRCSRQQGKDILSIFLSLHFSKDEVADAVNVLKKSCELLLVLDGYDGYVDKRNLWEHNGFTEYKIKTITFSRPEALSDPEFDKTFSYKFEGTLHKAKFFFLLPFASAQISSYLLKVVDFLRNLDPPTDDSNDKCTKFHEPWLLTKETTKLNPIWERDSSEYRHWFQLILPELGEVSQTPFLLCLLVQVLPTIVEEYRVKRNQSSFDMELVQLVSTEVGIYDQFTRRWFDYSSNKIVQIFPKLKEIENVLPRLLEVYSNNLAHRFFNRKQGFVGDGKISRKLTEEWDLWKLNENGGQLERNVLEDDTEKVSFLFPESENDNNVEKLGHLIALRSGCLLRYFNFQAQGGNYVFQFIHSSLLEYFVSRTIFKGLRAGLNFHLKHIGVKSTDFSFGFESIRSGKYVGILHMLVERARTDFGFKSLLLSVVRSSKETSSLRVMSSNAFTILTQAYRVWCDEDFSYVNIADADMSHCIFVNCNFKGADMSRALLTGTFFYQSHLQAANLFHSHISRGLNFHLQESVQPLDRKTVKQIQIFENEGSHKARIVYSKSYGRGFNDLCIYDVNKKTTKVIVGSPKWSVVDYRKLNLNQNVLLVVLQSGDNNSQSGQTILIFDPKNKSTLKYIDQAELRDQRNTFQTQGKIRAFTLTDGDVSVKSEVLEIFTISIPNYDDKVVCYRVPGEDETRIVVTSSYFPPTTSPHPFCFTIQSSQKITKSIFSLYQSPVVDGCTLLATSSDDFVTLFDLQKERILFQKKLSLPQHKGQLIVIFIRFSPDGKYLLFDMGQILCIVSLQVDFHLKEISLLGSKGGYDSMLSCDFSSVNHNRHIVALVYDHGTPLIVDLATGEKLQSIKLLNKCGSLSFIGGKHNPLQLVCASNFGSLSTHKIQSVHTGDPRSIEALNPRTDFHSLIDTNLYLANIFVSSKGKYMAVVTQPKHQFFKTSQDIYNDRIFSLLLFRIDSGSGKRIFVFNVTFSSSAMKDVQVSFINEIFLCLIYPKEFKVFECERPYLSDNGSSDDPVSVSVVSNVLINFKKSWYNELSQQIIIQQNDSLILELYAIEIAEDNSSISLNVPRFTLDLQKECNCSAVQIFFHTNEPDSFAYIFPFGQWICVIWNLKSGDVLILKTNELGESFKWEEVQHVSTIFVDNGFPVGLFIDFRKDASASFEGVVNYLEKTLELIRTVERNVYQIIESTNYFLSYFRNTFFAFGIQPAVTLFPFNPIHNVEGFQLMPVVTTDADRIKTVRLLVWNMQSISCIEVNLSAMEAWKGEKFKFPGWRLVWCDPPNDQFSLLLSNTTNAVLGRDEDWDLLSKRFGCDGKVSKCLHSFISLSSLFEQIHDDPKSIFSENKDLLLSDDVWILLVIAKKNSISANRLVNINVLQGHSGIIIEGIRNGRHFAFRADLFINTDKTYEITLAPLKRKKEKYFRLHKRYLAAEFIITNEQGNAIIDKILADKQSEIAYHLLYKNCNSWVKSLLALIGVDVDRKWSFVDLSNDFFATKERKNVLNFPAVTVTGLMS